MPTLSELKKSLLQAKEAYFTTGTSIMTDEEYDALEARVKREDPGAAAALDATGWTPKADSITLPVPLPSLDKGKFGERALQRFFETKKGPYVISDKLDGVSVLWDSRTGRLYNRGNGTIGTDITPYVPHIAGLLRCSGYPHLVRGEVVMKKADVKGTTPARSQVNGWLHNEKVVGIPAAAVLPLRFVAYQICAPADMRRMDQFKALRDAGYEIPWHTTVLHLTGDALASRLLARRAGSPYDIDGVVVSQASSVPTQTAENPADSVAFKMALDDQRAETTVVRVEWNISRQGVYIPRLEIVPVEIGGATITYVTGHNCKFVLENGIGPGARVTIRRSGDVIPIVEGVVKAVTVQLPAGSWDGVNIRAAGETPEQAIAKLDHSLKVLEVDGAGPATAKALVEGLIQTVAEILATPDEVLATLVGPGLGPRLKERLTTALRVADLSKKVLASPAIPRGFGKAKLATALEAYPDWSAWTVASAAPTGWSSKTWGEFCELVPAIRADVEGWNRLVGVSAAVPARPVVAAAAPVRVGSICMTGFRDAALAAASTAAGYTQDDNVKRSTTYLIVSDAEDPSTVASGKAAKAREYGVRILRASEWRAMLGRV
jgi:DNA ligase (NAD+)